MPRFSKLKERLIQIPRFFFLLLAFLLTISLVRNLVRISTANQRIDKERQRVEKLARENAALKEEVSLVMTDEFGEKLARDKLGLANEGEIVVVLPDEEVLRKLAPSFENVEESLPDPNWKRWLKLFL